MQPIPLNFLIYEENFLFFFISATYIFLLQMITVNAAKWKCNFRITVNHYEASLGVADVRVHLPSGFLGNKTSPLPPISL